MHGWCARVPRQWLLLGILFSAAGCAGSLNPIFETEDDLIDPKDFLGVWDGGKWAFRASHRDPEKGRFVRIELVEDPQIGRVTPESPKLPDVGAYLDGCLVRVGTGVFLDFTLHPDCVTAFAPDLSQSTRMLAIPVHSFLKVGLADGALTLHQFDVVKLDALLAKDPKLIAHKKLTADKDRPYPTWRGSDRKGAGGVAPQGLTGLFPSILFTDEPGELRAFLAQQGNADVWKAHDFKRGDAEEFARRWAKVEGRLAEAIQRRVRDETPRKGMGGSGTPGKAVEKGPPP